MISVPEKMTLCDLVDKIHIHIYREDRLLIAEGSVYVFATCAQREWNEMCCSSSKMYKNTTWKRTLRKTNAAEMMVFVCGRVFHLRVFDCVFAFLQLGDVQLWLGTIQSFEPHLIIVDGGDDGTAWHTKNNNNNNVSEQSPPSPLRCQRRVWWLCANTQEDAATKQEAKVKPAL